MKNLFFVFVILLFSFLSCRNEEDSLQKIDQTVYLYIDSAGVDKLNTALSGAYSSVAMNDVYGTTDSAPVSVDLRQNSDLKYFIYYLAGAKRIAIDSSGDHKTYESKMALLFTRKLTDSTSSSFSDTLKIQYNSTPTLFQVSKIWYNKILKFTKAGDELNVVKIQK